MSNYSSPGCPTSRRPGPAIPCLRSMLLVACLIGLVLSGCGVINPGKFKWIERTDKDEKYYLVKSAILTAGSVALPREHFDHAMQNSVNLIFKPAQERNYYVSKTVWYDPEGNEFRTIRQTHSKKTEGDKGVRHPKGPVTRVYTMPLYDLWKHKPGLWKVELFIDDQLARRLTFTVR
jgi:hypothetical protein